MGGPCSLDSWSVESDQAQISRIVQFLRVCCHDDPDNDENNESKNYAQHGT